MAIAYFDTSALVKLLVDETGSDLVAELWDSCDAATSSRLSYPEVRAALGALARNHSISQRALISSKHRWDALWASVTPVELSSAVEQHAGRLSEQHALKGADAVHLASALAAASPDFVFASWDRRLNAGAAAAGLSVIST